MRLLWTASKKPRARTRSARLIGCSNSASVRRCRHVYVAQTISPFGKNIHAAATVVLEQAAESLTAHDVTARWISFLAVIRVAVGTTIADRPPHRCVRARLRTRLLPRMRGGEANIRIGMQNAGLWNPPVQDGEQTPPTHPGALTATYQNIPPQSASAPPKDAQLSRVPGDSMVLVITQHHLPKPCAGLAGRVMLPALKFSLDGFQLRDHPVVRKKSMRLASGSLINDSRPCDPGRSCVYWLIG